jgi:plastocyanin
MMHSRSHLWLLVPIMLIATLSAACSRPGADSRAGNSQAAATPGQTPVVSADQPPIVGSSIIRGSIHFTGNPPAASSTSDTPRPDNCTSASHPSLGIVVNSNHTLKNVVIYLSNPPRPAPPAASADVLLDQTNCQYQPHVVALRTGQNLHIRSSDNMPHNVHLLCQANAPQNFGMLKAGDFQDISFANPEIFTARCDVHSWMSAVVAVFDHPWFAVSAADGSFQIDRVPAGEFTLVAWQETLPAQTLSITVPDSGVTNSDFTFAMP